MLLLISGGFMPSDKGAGGGAVSKKLFSLLRASVWSEHKGWGGGGWGGAGPAGPLPWIRHCLWLV